VSGPQLDNLIEIAPTTIAGTAAILAYTAEHVRAGNQWPDE